MPCARGALPPAFETIPDPINDVADIERLIGALAGASSIFAVPLSMNAAPGLPSRGHRLTTSKPSRR